MRYLFLLILLISFYSKITFSQTWKETEKAIGIKTSYGFILSHHQDMRQLQAHVPMLEINFNIATKGQKNWHKLYRYPTMGIAYVYTNLENPEVMGTAHAIMPYLRLPIIKSGHFEWNYRVAIGAGYLSKHFDRVDNIENTAIGSAFNIAANILFDLNFKLTKKVTLSVGLGMSHFSNAAFQTPNLGINLPALSIGTCYQIGNTQAILTCSDSLPPLPSKKFYTMIIGSYSLKGIYPPGTPQYSSYTVSAEASYKMNKRRLIGIGTDWIYDPSLLPRASVDSSYDGPLQNNVNYKAGIYVTETLVISHLQVCVQMGAYILRKYDEGRDFYNRFGLRYLLTKHFVANLSLRTHFTKADCIEWGVGYQF